MWRNLRIALLLVILLFVSLNTYFDRVYSTDWNIPLRVTAYPINADGSAATEQFIQRLDAGDLQPLENFFAREAARHGLSMERPVRLTLAPPLRDVPPMIEPGANTLSVIWWSLRTRYWSWRTPDPPGPSPDIKLFVLHHDPVGTSSVPHSIGLQKGLFGIVNVFADRRMMGSNDVVTAHELLHTLGATDKYRMETNQPMLPDGYAEPQREPLYPQSLAELMGGRIPVSADESTIPESLRKVLVGAKTASEIGWGKQ
jgi:hypothetical protein